ncbi:putative dUTP pyrophosphatase [Mycosarcoma maydis]|uniref:Deoxyuridine 5'-triphosphate nucleotidohydrolase n=1 Tax=Mycosarcoma maydis TaxID=5270 RepID=A0A0D1CQQ7_MYCMD|nr:putative dUTP pyrophosphatase [Ustilago maydis 521]KIS68923.1 putative dUTP pyrophosphatase [Ustilago maydis 521]|eukprot:XP_011389558.1 putative dUTP pyrophosphatase [Ustilago maydis 521]
MTSNICSDARTSDEARPTKLAKLEEAGTMSVNSTVRLLVQRHPSHPLAKLPTRGSALAAGYDLYSAEKVVLPQGGRKVVQTGICVAIPDGHYGRVAPRSGLASKHGIDTGAGVIDQDYRGLLGVLLFNLGEQDFIINQGDRIAQLILEKISTPDVQEVESLSETLRGAGGFGSTGGFGTQTTPSTADATAAAVAADLPAEVNAKSS